MKHEKLKYTEVQGFRKDMLLANEGICPVCSHDLDPKVAVLDHDHRTGHIRSVIHRDCNILLGKIENYTQYKGKAMRVEERLEGALQGIYAFIMTDWSHNPLHPKHLTANDKLIRKYKRLYKRSKRPETKAKYRKLIEELS